MIPRFITLEGGEGAGKTAQCTMLAKALRALGHEVLATREPGGSPGSEILRGILLSGSHDWSPEAETFLMNAARAEHVERTIRPAIAAGSVVVCDRYHDSTAAYQGHGKGVPAWKIGAMRRAIGFDPCLTIVLDVSEGVAMERMWRRGLAPDRFDALGDAFHRRIREAFREIAATEPQRCRVVDADRSREAVHADMLAMTIEALAAGDMATRMPAAPEALDGAPPDGASLPTPREGEVWRSRSPRVRPALVTAVRRAKHRTDVAVEGRGSMSLGMFHAWARRSGARPGNDA